MREWSELLDGVPTRLYDPGEASGLLLLGHRGTHSKDDEFYVTFARRCAAAAGVVVACIDAALHGERAPRSGDDAADLEAIHAAVATGQQQTVADWVTVAEHLSRFGPPVAFVGFSMGAVHGLWAVPRFPTIQAVVLGVAGVPSFAVKGRRPPGSTVPHLRAAAGWPDVPVLMLNATEDELIPPAGAHELFDAFPGSRKRMIFWRGDHGQVPADVLDHAVGFIAAGTRNESSSPEPG